MKKITKITIASLLSIFIIIIYEWRVYLWAQAEITPIIRVDIFVIYPIIFIIGVLTYFLLGRLNNK